MVYVKAADADEIKRGDVITYTLGTNSEYVMTHRVTEILEEEQAFITKGDANEAEDMEKVLSMRLIESLFFVFHTWDLYQIIFIQL